MNAFRQYLAAAVLSSFLVVPAVLHADCPDGTRDTSQAERQEYVRTTNILRAVPPAPAGWQLQTPRFGPTQAPTFTCKDLKLTVDPYDVVYVSVEHQRLNEQYGRERDARIAALRKLSPDEQKQVNDINRQAWQLRGPIAAATKAKNLTELARLREQYNQITRKAGAIYRAHADRIAPEVAALTADRSKDTNSVVRVRVAADDLPTAAGSGAEKVQIPGVPQAFFDRQKTLIMSFGRDAAGRNIRVQLEGDRERVMTIARVFAESSLSTLAAK